MENGSGLGECALLPVGRICELITVASKRFSLPVRPSINNCEYLPITSCLQVAAKCSLFANTCMCVSFTV